MAIESGYVDTIFGKFHYEAAGEGKPMLFIHGGTASAREWSWVLPDLGKHARCVAIDRLGCGASERSRLGYDRQTTTRSLLSCADALGFDRFGLAGQSFGGFWSFSIVFAAPERVSRLVIVNSGSGGPLTEAEMEERRQRMSRGMVGSPTNWAAMSEAERDAEVDKTINTIFANPSLVPAEYREYLRWQMGQADPAQAGAVAGEWERMARERYDLIACPTLVVWGEADSMNPADRGQRVAASIPGARYVGLPGVGHTCQIEDPWGFVAAVAPFLDETDAGA